MSIVLGPIMCLSGLVTTYFASYFTNRMERRQFMMLADVIFMVAAGLTQIPMWEMFTLARLLMGVTCGMDL